MNKNFEEAYKAEVQQNIPDLWNRIENSLPEKKTMQTITDKNESVPVSKTPVQRVKKKKTYAWIKWVSLAAACMLVIVTVPAVLGIGLFGIAVKEEAQSVDMAAPQMQDNASVSMNDAAAEEEFEYEAAPQEEYKDCEVPAAPAMDGETQAETEPGNEKTESEDAVLGAVQEEGLSSAGSGVEYSELVVSGLYAEVTEVRETEDFYEVKLAFSEMSRYAADDFFEGSVFYTDGSLYVRVYPNAGAIPETGGKYSVDIYNVSPPNTSMIFPYKAELK